LSSVIKRLAGQTAVYGLSNILGRLLNYLLVPLHTYMFSQAQYGTVTEFYAYSSFLFVLYTYGMETAFFRFSNTDNKDEVRNASMLSLLISTCILSLILFVASSPIASALGYENKAYYIRWFALIMAADTLCVIPFANLRLKNKPLRYAVIRLLNIGITITLNLYFLTYSVGSSQVFGEVVNNSIEGYVFLANLVASIITFLFFLPDYFNLSFTVNRTLIKSMWRYSWPLIFIGMAGMINETLDRILLKNLLPFSVEENLAQTGIYGACYKLSILMTLFIQAYRMAAEPFFFNESKNKDAPEIYARTMSVFIAICAFIYIGIIINLDFIKHFIDDKFHEGLVIVPVLLAANMCLGIYYNLSVWYKLTNKTLVGAWIALFGALITLALNIWWIPVFGYIGSAWATLVCYVSMMICSFWAGQYFFPVPYRIGRAIAYVIGMLVICYAHHKIMSLASLPMLFSVIVNVLIIGGLGYIIYQLEIKKPLVFNANK
jgi:O-antigen/teichoic acid export membrane protein